MKRYLLYLTQFLIVCILVGLIDCQITFETQVRPAPRQDPNQRNPFLEWLVSWIGSTTTTQAPPLTPPSDCAECKCGRTNQATRIVGGTETRVNQYPWMAMLQYGGTFYCGGSLITDQHVATAAHCVHGFNPNKISVVLLDHDRSSTTEAQTITCKVERVIKHNGYNSNNYNSDIAVLKLDQRIKFSDKIRPVCLPSAKKSFTGHEGIVTGWGATSENGQISVNLQEVAVPIMSNTDCKKTGYGQSRITDNMLCAGYPEGKKDSCQGDSGGPLHVIDTEMKSENVHQLAGIVSWGEGCAKPNYPGVYTRDTGNAVNGQPNDEDSIVVTAEGNPGRQESAFLEWLEVLTGIQRPSPPLKPAENCTMCQCGRTNTVKRIVGGMETRVNQYPWMTILKYNNRFYCGGTLITDRHVMTAAHCVHGFSRARMSVTLLDHDQSMLNETETITAKVERIYKHPKYSPLNYDNDIAVLRLDTVLQMNDKLRPVCQPTSGELYTGYDGIVTGWGTTASGGSVSPTLQEVAVPIMSNDDCKNTSYSADQITDNMMCAGYPEGMKDSCQGDSGGPLHVINKEMESENIHQIAGVVSWGQGCAKPDYPGVYSRVNRYEDWIKNNTVDGCYCTQ